MPLNKPTGDMLNAAGNATPANLGTAAAGTLTSYAREDHVHAMPTAADVGAVSTSDIIAISKGGTGSITAAAARTALGITPANIGAISTDQQSGFATLTSGTLTTSQVAALTGDVTSTAGSTSTTVVKLQGNSVSSSTPASGQALVWSGSAWAPATVQGGGGGGGANGLTYYFNQGTAPDSPTTGLPAGVKQLGRSGETGQIEVTSGTLTQNVWTTLASFISESSPIDPDVTSIPAGLWDVNAWALGTANANAPTQLRAVISIYNGTSLTTLGTSSAQVINGTSAQYSLSVLVPQTTIALTDRIFVALEVMATAQGHTATAQFGDSTPSHVHTSLPLVGGTGIWFSYQGNLQSPARLLQNSDVDDAAAIAASKIAGLAASATTDATNASNISSGTLSSDRLPAVSGLPSGAQGSSTVVPVVTVDGKGRVTALTTASISGVTSFSTGITGLSVSSSTGAVTLDGTLALASGGTAAIYGGDTRITGTLLPATIRHNSNLVPDVLGSATFSYTNGSTTVGYSNLTAGVTLVPGMSVSTGALQAGVIRSIDTGASTFVTTVAPTASGTATGNIYNTSQTGFVSGTAPTLDGRTMTVGDIVLLTNQTANAQNGPWRIDSTAGSKFTMSRPTWFRGTFTGALLFDVQYGNSNSAFIVSVMPNAISTTTGATIGIDGIAAFGIAKRADCATVGGNTFSGIQTFSANSPSGNAPFKFASAGTGLNTTPIANQCEWDGTLFYLTTNAGARTTNAAFVATPATSTSAGVAGQIAFDASYLYICTATNTWRRIAHSTF